MVVFIFALWRVFFNTVKYNGVITNKGKERENAHEDEFSIARVRRRSATGKFRDPITAGRVRISSGRD